MEEKYHGSPIKRIDLPSVRHRSNRAVGYARLCAGTGSDADKQARVAAIKQSLAQNQATLKQYTWVETTQVSMKGEVKKEEQKQCFYGADGKVQKTPLPGAAPPQQQQPQRGGGQRGGRVKKNIVENKVEDLKDYLEKVAVLVKDYVPPDPQNIQAAEAAGNMSVQPGAQGRGHADDQELPQDG